jgi:hypothetical protein
LGDKNAQEFARFSQVDLADRFVAVIVTYNRPKQVEKLCASLTTMKAIKIIVVLHGKHQNFTEIAGAVNIEDFKANDEFGAARRFFIDHHAVLKALPDATNLLFLDDDVTVSEALVTSMLAAVVRHGPGIYGTVLRTCDKTGYGFAGKTYGKPYDTILTGVMATKAGHVRRFMAKFWPLVIDRIRAQRGNCDDLMFNIYTRRQNLPIIYVKGKFKINDDAMGYSANPNHMAERKKFCKEYAFESNSYGAAPNRLKGQRTNAAVKEVEVMPLELAPAVEHIAGRDGVDHAKDAAEMLAKKKKKKKKK